MLMAGFTSAVLLAIVAGAWKWMTDDGPARLAAGLVAVLSKDAARRKDARLVLEVTKHQRGPEPGSDRSSNLPVHRLSRSIRRRRTMPAESEAAVA